MTKRTQRHRTSNLAYLIKQLGYKQYEVAEGTNIPLRTLNDYCKGRTTIPRYRLETLAAFLECPISALLSDAERRKPAPLSVAHEQQSMSSVARDILGEASNEPDEQSRAEEHDKPEEQSMDERRRKLMKQGAKIVAEAPFFFPALEWHLLGFSVEEYLAQCNTSVQDSWELMRGKDLSVAEHDLSFHTGFLMQIVYGKTGFQAEAAALATQAKIAQAILAMHRLDISAREQYCMEAITCARISKEPRLLAAALCTLAGTYAYHSVPRQPEHAVVLFRQALQQLGADEPLLRGVLHSGLADALAQQGDEKATLANLELAQTVFPSHPEHDPSLAYMDCDKAGLRLRIGMALVDLAHRYPGQGYYEQAEKSLAEGIMLQAMAERSTSELLIYQSAAALGFRNLELYESSMRQGLILAREVGSHKRHMEAYTIFRNTPDAWHTDQRIKDLEEEFFSPTQLPKGIH